MCRMHVKDHVILSRQPNFKSQRRSSAKNRYLDLTARVVLQDRRVRNVHTRTRISPACSGLEWRLKKDPPAGTLFEMTDVVVVVKESNEGISARNGEMPAGQIE